MAPDNSTRNWQRRSNCTGTWNCGDSSVSRLYQLSAGFEGLGMRPVAPWLELIHPEDRARLADASAAAIRPGVHATTWNTGCCVLMGPCESSTAGVKSLGTTRDGLCAPGLARRQFDAARESSRVGIDEHSSLLARASRLVDTLACRLSDRKAAFGGALAERQCVGT
jgi:hypothetical protein